MKHDDDDVVQSLEIVMRIFIWRPSLYDIVIVADCFRYYRWNVDYDPTINKVDKLFILKLRLLTNSDAILLRNYLIL